MVRRVSKARRARWAQSARSDRRARSVRRAPKDSKDPKGLRVRTPPCLGPPAHRALLVHRAHRAHRVSRVRTPPLQARPDLRGYPVRKALMASLGLLDLLVSSAQQARRDLSVLLGPPASPALTVSPVLMGLRALPAQPVPSGRPGR